MKKKSTPNRIEFTPSVPPDWAGIAWVVAVIGIFACLALGIHKSQFDPPDPPSCEPTARNAARYILDNVWVDPTMTAHDLLDSLQEHTYHERHPEAK